MITAKETRKTTLTLWPSQMADMAAAVSGLRAMNAALRDVGSPRRIRVYRSKYLNNIVEQDHRGVKRRTRPMLGFKSLTSAIATLDGIETAHMIRKGQLGDGCSFAIYASLAA